MGSSVTRLAISDIVSSDDLLIGAHTKQNLGKVIAAFKKTHAELTD